MLNNITPSGFKDDVTTLASTEHKFKNMMINHFQLNGFRLVKTPLVEYKDNYNDENTFKILTKQNEKKLNLRNDITLQVAKLSHTRLLKKKRPLKLCYYGEVVRKNGSMLRPERQFLQIGAECIGESNYLADVEMMELAYTSLSLVGIKDITIEISSRVFFDKFLEMIKDSPNKKEIKRLIKLKDLKNLLKILDKKNHSFIKNLFSCTGIYKEKKEILKHLSIDEITSFEILNIKNIIKKFSLNKKKVNIFLDLCEVDDKKYHSGLRFTFFASNVRGEVAHGGRYLVRSVSNEDSATGFTCYMDTILRASSIKLLQKKILVPFDISEANINKYISSGYSLLKNLSDSSITNNLAKDQSCQFYFNDNSIMKVK